MLSRCCPTFFRSPRRLLAVLAMGAMTVALPRPPLQAGIGASVNDPDLTVEPFVTGLDLPIVMAFIGSNDFLVCEKDSGLVKRVIDGIVQPDAVLDLAVENYDEQGLLGIAVHPQFPATNWVYLYFTASSTTGDTTGGLAAGNLVRRFEWNGSALVNPTPLLDLLSIVSYHCGGTMTFGPDGKLYAVIGDQEQTGVLQNNPLGFAPPDDTSVVFRLNDDGSTPDDNPFVGEGVGFARYYAYGIRNSFGLAFDPVTGHLWETENGDEDYDEINLVMPGFNSGWRPIMGPESRSASNTNDLVSLSGSQYSDPEFSWFSTVAPTALAFLNSTQLGAEYENDLFVGENNSGRLYRFELNQTRDALALGGGGLADMVADNTGELSNFILGTGFGAITDIKVGPDGKLYVVSIEQGAIYVIAGENGGGPGSVDLTGSWAEKKPFSQKCKTKDEVTTCKLKGSLVLNNTGDAGAPQFTVRFHLSDDDTFGIDDQQIGEAVIVKKLTPGKAGKARLKATLTGIDVVGKYIFAKIDSDEGVDESDEANNLIPFGPVAADP